MSLLLHLIAIVLVWDALSRVIPRTPALIAAAIFAVHPFQAEPVNYIFARSTLLATVFCVAALAAWLRGHPWRATLCFAVALLAKEECVAFPVFLLLLDWARGKIKTSWRAIAAMLALSAAAGVRVMLAARATPGSGAGAQAAISWQSYLSAQGLVILRYVRMLLIPWGFTIDPDIPIPPAWIGGLGWLIILGLAIIAVLKFSQLRTGFWFIAGLILLLPSSSVFPATDLAADRRMYLPMLGFAACAGLALERARLAFLVPVLILLTGLSFQRTLTWHTEETLWADAAAKAPRKSRPKIQLARAVTPDRGIQILEQAGQAAPNDPRIPSEEGRIFLNDGKPAEALAQFGRALALAPRSAEALNNRGVALLALDQRDAAREDFERALKIDACQFDARLNLLRLGLSQPVPPQCKFSEKQMSALKDK